MSALRRRPRPERQRGDRGATLVELLVAMTLTAVIGGVVTVVTVDTWRTERVRAVADEQAAAARTATELLSRDLRDARAVLAASPSSVTVWDDRNTDYRRQPAETYTWAVDPAGRLCRTSPAPETRCVTGGQGAAVVTFTYLQNPAGRLTGVGVELRTGSDSPARTWSVALGNLR